MSLCWSVGRLHSGGALTTLFSRSANHLYSGGFLGLGFSRALPFDSDFSVSLPPDLSAHPMSGVYRRWSSELFGTGPHRGLCAH